MLAHQRRRIVAAGLERGDDRRVVVSVAQTHGQVAQPARVADAPDRAAGHAGGELGRRPGEQRHQRGIVQAVAHRKIRLRARLGIAVPRADKLAVVTAVDAVADQRTQRFGNAALEFDGEVGNAAARIELVGRDDGAGRAGVQTGVAATAVLARRRSHWQRQVGVDLTEKEERAGVPGQQQRVLAAPAQARLGGERHLQHRGAVGKHPIAETAHGGSHALGQALQLAAQDAVIVTAERVARDVGLA